MGQKTNPKGLRLGIIYDWDSNWFAIHNYRDYVLEDFKVRKYLNVELQKAAISEIVISRKSDSIDIKVKVARPGILYNKSGFDIELVKNEIEKLTKKKVVLNVVEDKHPDLNAKLLATWVAGQLEKRIPFRRAMKMALQRSLRAGAKGVKITVSGRLGGAEIARTEQYHEGSVPLNTLRAHIKYGFSEALTTFGKNGVKVLVYLGENVKDQADKIDKYSEKKRVKIGSRK